jgi:hypothetical protein
MTDLLPPAEIGRRLNATELTPEKIVVIKPPGHTGMMFTCWVKEIDDTRVMFWSGTLRWYVLNWIDDSDKIIDDQGREVEVYEYLGEP